jgi:FMN reductase (NADPH)/FMN reductase [NAD(P)H]
LENGEEHAELLGLPQHTLPIAMLCLGRPSASHEPVPRYTRHLVHADRYQRLTPEELQQATEDLQRLHAPHGLPPDVHDYAEVVIRRKYVSDFAVEMNRSVAWWLERWQTG